VVSRSPAQIKPAEHPSTILDKAFEVLHAFTNGSRVMTFSEVVRTSGMPKSTVHRVLARLIELGVIERHGVRYRIGVAALALAGSVPASAGRNRALPHLEALHARIGHPVQLAVLRGRDAVFIEKLSHPGAIHTGVVVGTRIPAHCTAAGKALLCGLDPVERDRWMSGPLPARTPRTITDPERLRTELLVARNSGVTMDHGEALDGIGSVGAPVWFGEQTAFAVSATFSLTEGIGPQLAECLRETAIRLTRLFARSTRQDWLPQHD